MSHAIFVSSHFNHFMVATNRILINSDTISHIFYYIFVSAYREVLFYVADIRVARRENHSQGTIFQIHLLPILVLSPLGEIAPNGENKRQSQASNEKKNILRCRLEAMGDKFLLR